ncbi:MAG: hypothetical protein II893_03825 [Methanomicrobium sp.]|nr:hypothetical protein [Methanomicrobium sp.]
MIPPVSAGSDELKMWGYSNPSGNPAQGDEVYALYTVEYDFDSDQESLMFYTDLYNPVWKFTIILDGVEHVKPKISGRYETLSGFELYYPRTYQTYVRAELTGTVPTTAATGEYKLIEVTHFDAAGNTESTAKETRIFINPADMAGIQGSTEVLLSNLRADIDRYASVGVDTSAAEEKFTLANNAVATAKTSTASVQNALLDSAKGYIAEANEILKKAYAEHAINAAKKKTASLDSIINYFEVTKGLASDKSVWVIKSYNDNAKTLLVLAEEKYSSGSMDAAAEYAVLSQNKADEGYSCARSLNSEQGLNMPADGSVWSAATVLPSASTANPSTSSGNTAQPTQSTSPLDLLESLSGIGSGSGSSSGSSSSSASQSSSDKSSSPLSQIDQLTGGNGGTISDIDDILHSEVSVESTIKIFTAIYSFLVSVVDFLMNAASGLSSAANM